MSATENTRKASATKGIPAEVAAAVEAAQGRKALDLVVLDLRALGSFTDFFVICSGQNVRQVQAIADAVEESLRRLDERPSHIEGRERADWVLLDYFDFIVHVFSQERREFFALERLWGSAERIEIPSDEPAPRARKRAPASDPRA